MTDLTYHIKLFNDKVRALNQTSSKVLTLTAAEARNLHSDLYDLLAQIAVLTKDNSNDSVNMDGGGF